MFGSVDAIGSSQHKLATDGFLCYLPKGFCKVQTWCCFELEVDMEDQAEGCQGNGTAAVISKLKIITIIFRIK